MLSARRKRKKLKGRPVNKATLWEILAVTNMMGGIRKRIPKFGKKKRASTIPEQERKNRTAANKRKARQRRKNRRKGK